MTLLTLLGNSTAGLGDGLYVEFTPDAPAVGAGTINVYRKDGTLLGGPWYVIGGTADVWHTITICYDPDTDPNEIVVTFDPNDGTNQAQSFNVMLPAGIVIGTKAGYGGMGSIKNYKYDRLWYCGDSTEDCHELDDSWDYYNPLPERTYCHTCTRCPTGPATTQTAHWNQLSGTWAFSAYGAVATGADAKAVSYAGQSQWQATVTGTVTTYAAGDQGIIGMSDFLGRTQIYVVVSKSDASSGPISVGVYYDEDRDRFYWWISRVGNASVTYSIYRVTDGAAASLEVGPTTIAPTDPGGGNVVLGDGYVTVHFPVRNFLMGSGATNSVGVLIGGVRNQCTCGGAIARLPRKYAVVVAGLAAGSTPIYGPSTYFDTSRLNRTCTLRNYFHYMPESPYVSPCDNCCHSNWILDPAAQLTWFTAIFANGLTELYGYAFMQQSTPDGAVPCQVTFRKTLAGKVDVRDLTGEELAFDSVLPAGDFIVGTGATFTVTAVV